MKERFYNVYRNGNVTMTGKVARVSREAAARAVPFPRIGMWRVVDHTDTIEALCGPWGRSE